MTATYVSKSRCAKLHGVYEELHELRGLIAGPLNEDGWSM